MKRYYDTEQNCMMAIDGEYESELTGCNQIIAGIKSSYMRKNSRTPAKIILRCNYSAPNQDFWKYYLELHINGKMIQQHRICQEAYDVLKEGKPVEDFKGSVEFIIYMEFEPETKPAATGKRGN